MNKTDTRRQLRDILTAIEPLQRSLESRKICDTVIGSEQFGRAAVVMTYLSMRYEVDTAPIILYAWQRGKTVAVPRIFWRQRHMIPVEITSLETGFSTEEAGLRNPQGGVPVPYEDIDLVLTPGLGFDRVGNRLGRGGSYYDRFFRTPGLRAAKWALSFDEQILEKIPYDNDDVPMDVIVSGSGIIQCRP